MRYDEVGGTRVLRAFYDTARSQECAFQLIPGGAACLPQSALARRLVHRRRLQRSARRDSARSGRPLAADALVTDAANACDAPPTVRALGDVFPPTQAYYLKSDGSCMQNPPDAKIVLRRIGDEVPINRFVHATPTRRAGLRLRRRRRPRRRRRRALHDARQRRGARRVDAQHGLGDGTSRWWPVHVAYNYGAGAPGTPGSVFADAACSQPTGIKDAHDALCPITTVIEYVAADPCQQYTIRLHQAGAPIAASDLHAIAADGSCVASMPGPSDPVELYVAMGDALPDDAFPAASIVDVGDGRIAQHFDGPPDGSVAITARGELFDRARNVACFVGVAADGQRRCLPGGQVDTIYFADAACTTPIVGTSVAARLHRRPRCCSRSRRSAATPIPSARRRRRR